MNLLDASKLVRIEHVTEAVARLSPHNDYNWLYDRTGREEPDHRYIVVEGIRFPSKAFGFFVAQIAGRTDNKANDMNVNQAVAPLRRLGYVEVNGPGNQDTPSQREARQKSYYLTLARPGQARFRETLMRAYNKTCAVSGCKVSTVLEAAHVTPFKADGEDSLCNGILLRTDLHRLFDADELAIDPETLLPVFSEFCSNDYQNIPRFPLTFPLGGPSANAWDVRWKAFKGR